VVQECGVGLVTLRRAAGRLAFAAPPCRRTGPLDPAELQSVLDGLHLPPEAVVDHQWVDNGPGWCAVQLPSAADVLALEPDWIALRDLNLGVVGAHPSGDDARFEVRAFVGTGGFEDPVTGSLNASLAQWMTGTGAAPPSYVVAQGAALGRAGRVHVELVEGTVWIGGDVADGIEGTVRI
jgi:predicted PhzF superfamily epimerase YddE/YHI9